MDRNAVATLSFRWGLLLAVLAAAPALAQEPTAAPATAPAAKQPTQLLFVGSKLNAPYSFLNDDNLPDGYDVEVLQAIADQLGRAMPIDLMDSMDEAIGAVEDGEAVGLVGYGSTRWGPDVTDEWMLCGPTVTREYKIALEKDSHLLDDKATHQDLKGFHVAALRDDPVLGLLEMEKGVIPRDVKSPREALDLLRARWVRAFVADTNTIRYTARRWDGTDLRMVGGPFYRVDDHGPAISKRYDPALAADIRRAVETLRANGTLAKLQAKWFDYDVNPRTRRREIFIVALAIGGLAVLCLLAVAWRQALRSSVARRTRRLHAELEVVRRQLTDLQSTKAPAAGDDKAFDLEAAVKESRPLELEATDVNALITDLADALGRRMGDSVHLTLALGDDVPPAEADPERIRRILTQLCLNARDAVNKHRLTHPEAPSDVWVSTRLADPSEKPPNFADTAGDFLAISVRDAGCGIRKEMVQRIFHKGYTTRPNASGYGLTYVYETLAKHGGWIDVESAPGRGATFSIFLPCA